MQTEKIILAGDIGGTKTVLAVFSNEKPGMRLTKHQVYPSQDFASLSLIIQDFLNSCEVIVDQAVFAVAGPVIGRQAQITNLPWNIDADEIAADFGWPHVDLLNDLEAVALAIPHLPLNELLVLQAGKQDEHGTKSVVAPGTGLGESFLTWDGIGFRAYASEGGHADFAARTRQEFELMKFVQDRLGIKHVSYERLCSGSGIPNIYYFLLESGWREELEDLSSAIYAAEDPTPLIVGAALDEVRPSPVCQQTLRIFVSLLGAEAGNMALNLMARGGVYLAGGIPPRILPYLESGEFLKSFNQKGRFEDVLKQIPVYVVLNAEAGLIGAAQHGLRNATSGV